MQAQLWKLSTTSPFAVLSTAALGACQSKPTALDPRSLAELPRTTAAAVLDDWPRRAEILLQAGIADAARRQFTCDLIPEVLADLALFSADSLARPRDVRIEIAGQGSEDTQISLRALPLLSTLGDLRRWGELPTATSRTLAQNSALAKATQRGLVGQEDLSGSVISLVAEGLAQDGKNLIITGPSRTGRQN